MDGHVYADFLDDIQYPEVKTYPVDEEEIKVMAKLSTISDMVDKDKMDYAVSLFEEVMGIPEIDEENY